MPQPPFQGSPLGHRIQSAQLLLHRQRACSKKLTSKGLNTTSHYSDYLLFVWAQTMVWHCLDYHMGHMDTCKGRSQDENLESQPLEKSSGLLNPKLQTLNLLTQSGLEEDRVARLSKSSPRLPIVPKLLLTMAWEVNFGLWKSLTTGTCRWNPTIWEEFHHWK